MLLVSASISAVMRGPPSCTTRSDAYSAWLCGPVPIRPGANQTSASATAAAASPPVSQRHMPLAEALLRPVETGRVNSGAVWPSA